jgi:hypothetical protein
MTLSKAPHIGIASPNTPVSIGCLSWVRGYGQYFIHLLVPKAEKGLEKERVVVQ